MRDPEVIIRLQQIHDKNNGVLRESDVINDAKNPKSPLHKFFEWDKDRAHEKYLLIQARQLIRSVRIEIKETRYKMPVIAYVKNPSPKSSDEAGYLSTSGLKFKKDTSREILMKELERAESALKRAYQVSESLGIADEFDILFAKIRNIMESA